MGRLASSALLTVALGASIAVPASAGTVYVALATDSMTQGIEYRSSLRVTNTGSVPHFFVVHFIPSFSDGTERSEEALSPIGVLPGHTYVYENLTLGSARAGMLEITGDDQLVFSAGVAARIGQAQGEAAPVPIVGSEQLFEAGERIVVQGVRRDAARLTSFGLINLAKEAASCNVDFFGPNGAKLMPTVALPLMPLEQSFFHDVTAAAGVASAADSRFEAVCTQPAYAFAQVVELASATISPLEPSSSLHSSLRPPQAEPEGPVTQPCGGDFCFELPGTYFVPNGQVPVLRLEVPIPKGEFYDRLDIDMTVVHGGWYQPKPDGFHNFFWLFDGKWSGGTWGYVNARGPGKGLVTSLHFVGMPQSRRSTANLLLQPGATYRVHYTYDAGGTIETTFFDAGGAVLAKMTDTAPVKRIVFGSDAGVQLWFGLEGHFEEVPSFGWQYQNFQLSLTK